MVKLEQINRMLVKLLRDNLTDPLKRNVHWIFYGFPREKMRFPCIGVFQDSGARVPTGIGSSIPGQALVYRVELITNTEASATIDSDRYSGYKLLAYLVDKILGIIETKRYSLRKEVIEEILVIRVESAEYEPVPDIFRQTVWLEVTAFLS